MKRYLALAVSVLPLAGCGGGGAPAAPPAGFAGGVEHPYFPTEPGVLRIYEGQHLGTERRDEIRTLERAEVIQGVTCVAVEEELFLGGVLSEVSTEYYAQDLLGNVWKFGERSLVPSGGGLVPKPDSWIAGELGAAAWIAFPADPRPGDVYHGHAPGSTTEYTVLSLTASASVPAGTFESCLEILEEEDEPADADIILYAPGVGKVSERNPDSFTDLVEVRRPAPERGGRPLRGAPAGRR